jgi:hypothetical protein
VREEVLHALEATYAHAAPEFVYFKTLLHLFGDSEKEQVLLKQLYERSPELACARQLAQHFLRLVRERRGRELDDWVADVHTTGPPELRGFSRNLPSSTTEAGASAGKARKSEM